MTTAMQSKVIINGLKLYAYHGVMEQERKVGAYFTIDVEITTDLTAAITSDLLNDTISYADVYETIKHEMTIPSKLLEHVAGRIAKAILANNPTATGIRLKIMKENPPMGADCQGAGVEIILP